MAAMKPRTGDGPLEVTKEGRGIVMRVPLEGGGRLVVELNAVEAKELGEALSWCEKALRADKVNPELHYLRATILQEQGDLGASILALKRVIFLEPQFAMAHFTLGNIALQTRHFEEARRHFANALSILSKCAADEILRGSDGLTAGRLRSIISATQSQEKFK